MTQPDRHDWIVRIRELRDGLITSTILADEITAAVASAARKPPDENGTVTEVRTVRRYRDNVTHEVFNEVGYLTDYSTEQAVETITVSPWRTVPNGSPE